MEGRRAFIKKIAGLFPGMMILSGIIPSFLKSLYGRERKVMFSGGHMESRQYLSEKNMQLTPLNSFGVMGKTDIYVDKNEWHLEIISKSGNSINYSYDEILRFPSFEKKVLLDCPGFFQNHGLWKGFSLGSILKENSLADGFKKVEVSGLNGRKNRTVKFSIDAILNDRVFLAYGVNRKTLPVRNGHPLRVVAEKYSGSHWIKYINQITLI